MILNRTFSTETVTEGRTLSGIAFYWDTASNVTDNGKTYYKEAFTRTSTDKTLSERKSPFVLGFLHPWSTNAADKRPLGPVTFHRATEGLMFEARLSKTVAADEMLELIKDNVVGDVSVGFRAIKSAKRDDITLRTEIGLLELSLAPIGMAQHQGAQVLAVRSDAGTPRLDEYLRKLALLTNPII